MTMIRKADFDLHDWYWIVAKDTDKVFSSRKARYVPAGDKDYVDWSERGRTATRIASEQELVDAFANGLPDVVPRIPRALLAYSKRQFDAKEREQWSFKGKPMRGSFAEQTLIALARSLDQDKVPWLFADDSHVEDMNTKELGAAMLARSMALIEVAIRLAIGISNVPPTITEPKQIDDAYAAVK